MDAGRLARDLRATRRRSGLTFRSFAQRAGFSESHLRSVENGHRALTGQVATAYDQVLGTGGVFLAAVQEVGRGMVGARYLPPALWDQASALPAMTRLLGGGGMDRREFVTVSGAALTTLAARWSTAVNTSQPPVIPPESGSRRVEPSMTAHIAELLNHLRHLDDELGSGDLAQLARAELALIVRLLRHGTYTDQPAAASTRWPPRQAGRRPGITSTRPTTRSRGGTSRRRCAPPLRQATASAGPTRCPSSPSSATPLASRSTPSPCWKPPSRPWAGPRRRG